MDLTTISDTLDQYAEPYVNAPPTPESEVYVVSDKEIRERKIARIIFLVGIALLIGYLVVKRVKK